MCSRSLTSRHSMSRVEIPLSIVQMLVCSVLQPLETRFVSSSPTTSLTSSSRFGIFFFYNSRPGTSKVHSWSSAESTTSSQQFGPQRLPQKRQHSESVFSSYRKLRTFEAGRRRKCLLLQEREDEAALHQSHRNCQCAVQTQGWVEESAGQSDGRRANQGLFYVYFSYQLQIENLYEANIDPEVKFMAQTGIVGCGWVEIPPGKATIIPDKNAISRFVETSIKNIFLGAKLRCPSVSMISSSTSPKKNGLM